MDNHTKEQRSYNMSRIRSTDTAPEEKVRKWLHAKGFRYRKNVSTLPGKPDIVLRKHNAVIFVHGCFWHMHDCSKFHWPKSNLEYWKPKILNNAKRDARNKEILTEMGWKVLIVWECQLKKERLENTLVELCNQLGLDSTV